MRPNIEALNNQGHPYIRPARYIGELPTPDERMVALQSATKTIAALINMQASKRIPFGVPAYTVFMTRPEAAKHPQSKMLLTHGSDLRLDLCPDYN